MYMTVYDLSREQLEELRNKIFYGCHETSNLDIEEKEMVNNAQYVHEIPDKIAFSCFSGYDFTNDDFFCTAE